MAPPNECSPRPTGLNACDGRRPVSASSGGGFDVDGLRERCDELEGIAGQPDLWEDRERAEKVMREKRSVERELAVFDSLSELIEESEVLLELAVEADDPATRVEAAEKLDAAEADLEEAELRRLLGGDLAQTTAGPELT